MKLYTLALLAVLPAFLIAPATTAETVVGPCGAVTVLTADDLSDSFTIDVCAAAVDWSLVRNPTDQTVTWTVTTDLDSTSCTWGPGVGAVCSGPRPVPATMGSTADISISATAGNVVGVWRVGA